MSDFVPEQTPDHKIQTSEKLDLRLKSSPKILGRLVREDVLTVSFKLETDQAKLEQRMADAISKYGVHVVMGNILNLRNRVSIRSQAGLAKELEGNVEKQMVEFLIENQSNLLAKL